MIVSSKPSTTSGCVVNKPSETIVLSYGLTRDRVSLGVSLTTLVIRQFRSSDLRGGHAPLTRGIVRDDCHNAPRLGTAWARGGRSWRWYPYGKAGRNEKKREGIEMILLNDRDGRVTGTIRSVMAFGTYRTRVSPLLRQWSRSPFVSGPEERL